ncbi:MAG TPA: V-type ATP synthase subunit E family protein [Bacillota bacterium]|nr:hypothetical protein [Bacillota bacterium]HOA14876.1 V-type ATP synthase subunit E family protein [Bacillota bacterium]HOG53225.1 V-type ATP synthase subunit E family protein [Bacillota bacterium]
MENLSPLVKKITERAQAEAASIIAEAEEAALKTLEAAGAQSLDKVAAILREAESKGQEMVRRARVQASLSLRNGALEKKGEWVRKVLDALPGKLHSLNDKDYSAMIRGFVLSVAPTGLVRVVPAEADKALFNSSFVKGLNEVMEARGQDTTFVLPGETDDFEGGLLLLGENVSVDCSLASICEYHTEVLEPIILEALFPEGTPDKELWR